MLAENEAFVHELLAKHAGVTFSAEQGPLLSARLASLAKVRNLDSADALVRDLRNAPQGPLLESVIEALTTHETSFFRDSAPFNALADSLLPHLIKRRHSSRRLAIWSAGCSTGQEAYSVAMLLRERFPELARWQVRIWGTDVSRCVVERARDGTYSELEMKRGLTPAAREKYFSQVDGGYRITQSIRGMVTWDVMNLSGDWPPMAAVDVILLRNVLIYFPPPTRVRILERAATQLRPDGYLLLGASETTFGVCSHFMPFVASGTTVYRKPGP
jgi:chemotaxis protein methyltransferase CheR